MKVPLVNLQRQFEELRERILPAVENVMSTTAFVLGPDVTQFETEFASFCTASHCLGVGSGCDALLMALKACDIGPGDEVILPTNTYIATALAVTAAGARPVLVDCLEDSYQIDPEEAQKAITDKTRGIMPVHLYGHPADMDAILGIAGEHGLTVIEDAAQAHGAEYKGRRCGSMGKASGFSFYPGKNLGAYGDGGAVTTNDPGIADAVNKLRNYGQSKKYYHDVPGWNTRLDTVQAAILRIKLERLDAWNDARRKHAQTYGELLADLPIQLPIERPDCRHIYHIYAICCDRRDALLSHLHERGIGAGIHYPIPIHLQQAYRDLGYE